MNHLLSSSVGEKIQIVSSDHQFCSLPRIRSGSSSSSKDAVSVERAYPKAMNVPVASPIHWIVSVARISSVGIWPIIAIE